MQKVSILIVSHWGFLSFIHVVSVPPEGPPPPFFASENGKDHFWVVDAAVRYRLPKHFGLLSLEVKNLFDETFQFQDSDPSSSSIYPDQVILLKFAFKF